jgi:Mrp family chromosome partitioning ATPase
MASDNSEAKNYFPVATPEVSADGMSVPTEAENLEAPLFEPFTPALGPSTEKTASLRFLPESSVEKDRFAMGQGEDFRIIDDPIETAPRSASVNMQKENEFYILDGDAAEAESIPPSEHLLRMVDPESGPTPATSKEGPEQFALAEEREFSSPSFNTTVLSEVSDEPTQSEASLFVGQSVKLRRRVKKISLYLGRRAALIAPKMEGEVSPPDEQYAPTLLFTDVSSQSNCETVKSGDHIERQAESIPQARMIERTGQPQIERVGLDASLVSFVTPDSYEAEQYRVLRFLVEQTKREKGRTYVVGVTSPSVGDGKTTTALNLAGSLAQVVEARVLLIDADLRHPSVVKRLGQRPVPPYGLTDVGQRPNLKLAEVMVHCAELNLTVLPAVGETSVAADELLQPPRINELLEEVYRQFDYVVVDAPPLLSMSGGQPLENWVDGFFVVVAAHKTPRKLVQSALSIIKGEKMLGLVFNGDDSLASSH